jgi:hypothetical protein
MPAVGAAFPPLLPVPASVPSFFILIFLAYIKKRNTGTVRLGLFHTHARARWGSLSRSVPVFPNAIRCRVYAAFCVERWVEQRWNGGTLPSQGRGTAGYEPLPSSSRSSSRLGKKIGGTSQAREVTPLNFNVLPLGLALCGTPSTKRDKPERICERLGAL